MLDHAANLTCSFSQSETNANLRSEDEMDETVKTPYGNFTSSEMIAQLTLLADGGDFLGPMLGIVSNDMLLLTVAAIEVYHMCAPCVTPHSDPERGWIVSSVGRPIYVAGVL